jgi:glutaredoxin
MLFRVYSTPTCPKCEQLKKALAEAKIKFDNMDMTSPEALTELRVNGVFTLSAPVLQVEERFYTVEEIFDGDRMRNLDGILKG